ncbi:hypothetical protein [Staphylococcus pseudintermedius]|uniref:hypothetical protein n=1 Tax=Staphylococcus pseudintermedius TaxID=283734 RepID=UPI0018F8C3CC|nr:hypothetical protein [Staphylococcus pseudintermedius]
MTDSKVYKEQRDSLTADLAKLLDERDKLSDKLDEYCNTSLKIEGQLVDVSKERDDLKRKLDDVVSMVNAYVIATKAYSGESAYNLLENELNRILEDE